MREGKKRTREGVKGRNEIEGEKRGREGKEAEPAQGIVTWCVRGERVGDIWVVCV